MQRELPPNRLRELREARGLKLYDLAVILRVETSTISRWETNATMMPDWAKLALADYFEVAAGVLMGWDEKAAA